MTHHRMSLAQVALSSTHLLRTNDWYCKALGFVPAGSRRHREVPGRGLVSGLPEASLDVWCLMGGLDWMQFEVMEFEKPRMRQLPSDWVPSDIGYSTVGIVVSDFDAVVRRIRSTSGRFISVPVGVHGQRRLCLRDPDGVLLEIREHDFPTLPTSAVSHPEQPLIRFVTASVHDLDDARRFWVEGLGLNEVPITLHDSADEELWGFRDTNRKSAVIDAGAGFIELVQYLSPPARWRPSGYLFSDQGILNVALGSADEGTFFHTYERALDAGYRSNSEPLREGEVLVVYLNDGSGNSVELLCVPPPAMEKMGFVRSM